MSSLIKANQVSMGNEKVMLAAQTISSLQQLSDNIDQLEIKRQAILAEAEQKLEEAKAESKRILDDARMEAEKIIKDSNRETQVQRQEVIEEAKKLGYEAGNDEATLEMEGLLKDARRTLDEANAEAEQIFASIEPHVVEILKRITEKVICTQIKYNDDVLVHMIQSYFNDLNLEKRIKIKVGQEHYRFLVENRAMLYSGISDTTEIEIIEDSHMVVGDCIIETPNGNIDISIKDQIKGVQEYIELLALSQE